MKIFQLIVLALLTILAISCGGTKTPATSKKLSVVCTVGMITDVAQTIAGNHADVIGLMGPGVDPHLYKVSHGDVEKLTNADLVLYNGLHLEGKMADVLVQMARERAVVPVTRDIPDSLLREPPEFEGHYDPHVWMDPLLWARCIRTIAAELASLRPGDSAQFTQRADSLIALCSDLDRDAREKFLSIPDEQRVLITAHDAFGYFGRAFNVEVHGLQGISTATEYGVADVTGLVDLISSRKVKAVFVESSVPTKPLEAVIEGCKSRGHDVNIGGTLFSDAMGEADTPEGTYIGMIRHNVNTIYESLK
jgi:manganese/zinc/iron transport system substrate-binding protein